MTCRCGLPTEAAGGWIRHYPRRSQDPPDRAFDARTTWTAYWFCLRGHETCRIVSAAVGEAAAPVFSGAF